MAEGKRNASEVRVFLLCVALASTIWFLRALNKDTKTELIVPLEVGTNAPCIPQLSTDTLRVEVYGSGFQIISRSLIRGSHSLVLHPDFLPAGSASKSIHTDELQNVVKAFVGKQLELLVIKPDSVTLTCAAPEG
jgi:hypothetical protein